MCAATDFPKGGSWSPKGFIVFAPASGGPLHVVSENGGESKAITKLDGKRGDNSHRLPFFLPDGTHFLFLARLANAQTAEGNQVLVGSLDGGEPKPIVRSPAAAEYASGRLLFLRDRALMAQRFDPSRLTLEGEPHPLVENVSLLPGAAKANFSASQAGVLVAQVGAAVVVGASLDWTDGAGKTLGTLCERAAYDEVAISPDGRSVAVTAIDLKAGTHDIWICDAARNLKTRFTFEPGEELTPRWSPDGRSIVYVSSRGAQQGLYRKRIEGSGVEELLYTSEAVKLPSGFSLDGKLLAYSGARSRHEFRRLDPSPGGRPQAVPAPEDELYGDRCRLLARREVARIRLERVRPVRGLRDPVSRARAEVAGLGAGRGYPSWRQGGKEILYQELQSNKIFSVPVSFRGDTPEFGKADELFVATPPLAGIAARFDSTADGKKFIVVRPNQAREGGALTLVVNWPAGLGGEP